MSFTFSVCAYLPTNHQLLGNLIDVRNMSRSCMSHPFQTILLSNETFTYPNISDAGALEGITSLLRKEDPAHCSRIYS